MNKLLKNIFFVFLALILMQNFVSAKELQFAQVSDIHYIYDKENVMDKYLYFLSLSLNKKHPAFTVFLGDNVDRSKEENVIGLMKSLYTIRSPYYLVFGDNDAHSFSGIGKEIYLDIVTTFNNSQKENKKYYYFKPNSDFICVVLDDTSDFAYSSHGEIPEEQIEWLDKLLTKYPKKLFIIFQHCPLIPPRNEYKLTLLNSDKYKEIISKHKNIILISSGHYHQEQITQDENGVRHISAPAFKDIPHSYQLIKIIYDENTYASPKDIDVSVELIKV